MDVEVQIVLQRCHLIRDGVRERLDQDPMETFTIKLGQLPQI